MNAEPGGQAGMFGMFLMHSNPGPLALFVSVRTLEGQCYIQSKPPARAG